MSVCQSVRSVRHVTKDDLLHLLDKNDFEILHHLNRTEFGFMSFLEKRRYKGKGEVEILEIVIKLLNQACSIRAMKFAPRLDRLLRMLSVCQNFLFDDIPRIINSCFTSNHGINLVSFMAHYMNILKTVLRKDFFPCERIVNEIFPALENYMNRLREKKVRNIEPSEISFKDLVREVECYENTPVSDEENGSEIFNFRSLPIFPRDNDIVNHEVSHVPQNIIDRPYKSVEHYLSVHYRLMREDMLRSFRECINPYTSSKGQSFSSFSKNLYFENVTLASKPKYTIHGIFYDIMARSSKIFDLAKKEVLMPGSLVFLTPNSFQSIICATVKKAPTAPQNKTKECKVNIKLEDDRLDDLLREDTKYEMIQPTTAYFECYKHVLSGIKSFNESSFPLSDIITYFEFSDPVPNYLVDKEFCLYENCGSSTSHDSSCLCKNFKPLNDDDWPTSDDLKLDDQQYIAFKTAITKKVAVLQGPPGTGKTYIGKKVVRALLENTRNKPTDDMPALGTQEELIARDAPIVVCCLTNHALDQFLEGIISEDITKKVVRLGSQSQSELLEPHKLDNLMYAVRQFHRDETLDKAQQKSLDLVKDFANIVLQQKIIPDHEPEYFELKNLCIEINANILSLSLCKDKYLEDNALNDIIDRRYKENLRNTPGQLKKSLSASILAWLACSHLKDLYNKCRKYFLDFKKRDISAPPFQSVWHLTETKRYELFYCWRKQCLNILKKKLDDSIETYKSLMSSFEHKPFDPIKLEILKGAFVIGVTTTGACKFKDLIRFTRPRIIIIEEAAQVLESHVIASLVPTIQHMILIGDHEQLRPLPANHDLSENYNLKISMFERLFRNKAPSATLVSQHRMRPCIAELLVPKPYTNYTSYENVYKYEEIRGVQSSVFFFDHREPEDKNSTGTSSSNDFEAQMIASLAKYFIMLSYSSDKITILATYAAQLFLIHKYLEELQLSGIHVTTVDNFQGEENDIILLSFVRNNPTTIGFLKESNRVCVALSRARKGLFCFGNFELFSSKNELWKNIVEKTRTNNMIGEILVLKCDKHQSLHPSKNSEDILTFIHNGCSEKCNATLPCNHKCVFTCHFNDPDHSHYMCKQSCERLIDENRVCPRLCYERCKRIKKKQVELSCGHFGYAENPMCFEEIQRLLTCGHFITVYCHMDIQQYRCGAPAVVSLNCGHTKTILCHELTEKIHPVCTELVQKFSTCGHTVNVPCSLPLDEKELIHFCKKSCDTILDCGHPCVRFCRWCSDSGIHSFCAEKCELVLSCGHKCQGYCNSPCPPCKMKCLYSCTHQTWCINECLRPCVKCEEPCARNCEHVHCLKECHEKCDVKPCMQPCLETLQCGHQCIGLCGDQCPHLCRICNTDCLSSNDPGNYLYVELECGDVIEVNELDEHIENCLMSFEWPCCPQCSKVIIQIVRYKEALMNAKQICIKSCDTSESLAEIYYLVESMYGDDYIVPAQFLPIHRKIIHIIKKQNPKSDELFVLKNCIMLLKKLVLIASKMDEMCEERIQSEFDTLLLWIFYHLKSASFQQLNELELAVEELAKNVSPLKELIIKL